MNAWLLCMTIGLAPATTNVDLAVAEPVQKQKKGPTRLEFDIEPESVVIHVGNPRTGKTKSIGRAKKGRKHNVKPGDHLIKLVNGKDETEFVVRVQKGETLLVQYKFEDSGIHNAPPPEEDKPAPKQEQPEEEEEEPAPKRGKPAPRGDQRGEEPDDPFADIPD